MSYERTLIIMLWLTGGCGSSETPTDANEPLAAFVESDARSIRTVDIEADVSDLAAFQEIAGDARIVALGEVAHGTHENQQLRNRLFAYLIEHAGFKVVTLESGFLESRLVERHIQSDSSISLETARNEGLTHLMGIAKENGDLLEWMREYNDRQTDPQSKVHFIGYDLTHAGDSPAIPLFALAEYLDQVDATFAAGRYAELLALALKSYHLTMQVEAGFQALGLPHIDADLLDAVVSASFEFLTPAEQTALEEGLTELDTWMRQHEDAYADASSPDAWRWYAHHGTLAKNYVRNIRARQEHRFVFQIDRLRELLAANPVRGLDGEALSLEDKQRLTERFIEPVDTAGVVASEAATRLRELGHADNIQWIEENFGKVLLFAHNGHVIKSEFKSTTGVRAGDPMFELTSIGLGKYLAERYGSDYVVINASLDEYVDPATGRALDSFQGGAVTPTSSSQDAVEKSLQKIHDRVPMFALDIRKAVGAARAELSRERDHRYQTMFVRYTPLDAYDAIFYRRQMTPQLEE